jgi:hypothetical protein
MIIYHVDGSYISTHDGSVNNSNHQGLYPVCANATGNPTADYGSINSSGLPFPGTSLITTFNDLTTPNSRSWAGASTNKSISNIVENTLTQTVSFNVSLTTSVEKSDVELNALSQNYPNPFTQSTTIDFKINKSGNVSLVVFNSLGQVIDIIVDEFLFAGNYSKTWSPTAIPAGIYFYQLKGDGFKETKRLVKE